MRLDTDEDQKIHLTQLYAQDTDRIYYLIKPADISKSLKNILPSGHKVNDIAEYIEYSSIANMRGIAYSFAIRLKSSNALIGMIGTSSIDIESKATLIGYWIAKGYRRKGHATDAIFQLLRFCFEELGLERVYANIEKENLPSIKLVGKIGFYPSSHDASSKAQMLLFCIDKTAFYNKNTVI